MTTPRRAWLLGFVLVACSGRTRSACVGCSPEVAPADLDEVALGVTHGKKEPPGNWPDGPEKPYDRLQFALDLETEAGEPCRSVSKATTLEWNGLPVAMTSNGGATTKLVSRSAETTTCHDLRGELVSSELLGPTRGARTPDVFRVTAGGKSLAITFAAGRPSAQSSADRKEIVVTFDGLVGELRDPQKTFFALWAPGAREGIGVTPKARDGNRLRLAVDPTKLGAPTTYTLLGDVSLAPSATCAPAHKSCTVAVAYALRLPVKL